MPFPSLPDDVFLTIISCTDIDTFFSLRQLSRGTQALIDTHLIGVSKAVARATFPYQTRIFLQVPAPSTVGRCLHWLHELRYAQVAAILLEHAFELERPTLGRHQPVAAEDPLGDEIRALVTWGCRTSHHLSTIANGDLDVPSQTRAFVKDDGTKFERQKSCRLAICAKQMDYIAGLTYEALRGYQLLADLLSKALSSSRKRLLSGEVIAPLRTLLCDDPGLHVDTWIDPYHVLANLGIRPLWAAWWSPWSLKMFDRSVQQLVLGDRATTSLWILPLRNSISVCRQQMEDMRGLTRQKLLRTPPSADIPGSHLPHAQRLTIFQIPESGDVSSKRRKRARNGEPPPPFVFSYIAESPTHYVDCGRRARSNEQLHKTDANLERQIQADLVPLRNDRRLARYPEPQSQVLPEFQHLYREWKRCWFDSESWKKLAKEQVELYAGPEAL
ncbi:hypothetical protein LTS10_009772 [Elasticomyces elasticus]|nr:hypothetical protein LTS10_009772 [Elasticomyces elasticus]